MERTQVQNTLLRIISSLLPITFRFYLTKFVSMIICITNSLLLFAAVRVMINNNAIAHCGTELNWKSFGPKRTNERMHMITIFRQIENIQHSVRVYTVHRSMQDPVWRETYYIGLRLIGSLGKLSSFKLPLKFGWQSQSSHAYWAWNIFSSM